MSFSRSLIPTGDIGGDGTPGFLMLCGRQRTSNGLLPDGFNSLQTTGDFVPVFGSKDVSAE
jgi:hypothetical protein